MMSDSDSRSERAKRRRETAWIRRHRGVVHYGGRWLSRAEMIRLLQRLCAERRQRLTQERDA
jgi:hypothetical protein